MDPIIITDNKDCSINIIDSRNATRLQNLKEDSKVWKQIYNSRFKTITEANECSEDWEGKYIIFSTDKTGAFKAVCPEWVGIAKNGNVKTTSTPNHDLQKVITTIGKRLWRMNSLHLGLNSPLDITVDMIKDAAKTYLELDEKIQCFFCREPTRQSIDELVQIEYLKEYCEDVAVHNLGKNNILFNGELLQKDDPNLKKDSGARSLDIKVEKEDKTFYGFCKYSGPPGSVTNSYSTFEVIDFLKEAKNYLDKNEDLYFFAQIDGYAGESEVPLMKEQISDYEERIFAGNSEQVAAWLNGK